MLDPMVNQPKTPIRGIRVEDEVWERVKLKAKRNRETASDVVRRALEEYISTDID